MKEEFKSDGWKDFSQRYQGTFGFFERENAPRLLVQLVKVGETQLTFTDKAGMSYFANPDRGNVFSFIPVERGSYNFGSDVVMCSRVPARQWKRGLCIENTHIQSLSDGSSLPVDFTTLEIMFPVKEGRSSIPLERFKATLSGNVAFDTMFSLVNNRLFLYEREIGTYTNHLFTLTNHLFKQEVTDLITRHQLPISVGLA